MKCMCVWVELCNIPSLLHTPSPLQIITLAGWSDGVIISPASGYRKWPHALFTHAKMLIDDSFIYIFLSFQSHISHFSHLSFNPLFWRDLRRLNFAHSRFSNELNSSCIDVEPGRTFIQSFFRLILKLRSANFDLAGSPSVLYKCCIEILIIWEKYCGLALELKFV